MASEDIELEKLPKLKQNDTQSESPVKDKRDQQDERSGGNLKLKGKEGSATKTEHPYQRNERQPLLQNSETRTKDCTVDSETMIGTCIGMCLICGIVTAIVGICVSVTLYVNKVHVLDGSTGNVLLGNGDGVLLLEYNPNNIDAVELTIERYNALIYQDECNALHNDIRAVNETEEVNITESQTTYPLEPHYYMLKDSKIEYSFDITPGNTTITEDSECLIDINIFMNYSQYMSFLNDPASISPPISHCLSPGEPIFTLEAKDTSYYFTALRTSPEFYSSLEPPTYVITYTLTGSVHYYGLLDQQLICNITFGLDHPCTVHPATTQKSCILGTLPIKDNFVEVTYKSFAASRFYNQQFGATMGILFSSVFLFCMLGVTCCLAFYFIF